ncbi:MAG: galactose-1-phosphate uridylyltransferase [PVC group bacterium]|nr:galactose-1-phosphate uridylyltransferase [PVC group bacterium]
MQQFRRDPILGRWIIVQYDREQGPQNYQSQAIQKQNNQKVCPFCVGHEDKTPDEIYIDRTPQVNSEGEAWSLRVIENKFPALRTEGIPSRQGLGIYDQINGVGAHEVIIETANHDKDISDLTIEEVKRIILAYKHRCIELKQDKRLEYVLIFKNHGKGAGASLEHAHSQLIALPIVPKKVKEAMLGAQKYYEYKERCVFCDIIQQEIESKERIVLENDLFIAFAPFASSSPFETWIIPKKHSSHFHDISEQSIGSAADMLREVLIRLKKVLTDPPFNFIINTAPIQHDEELNFYHWHIEIVPKLTRAAGFEWGTGFYINPSPPEKTAKWLRDVRI